MQPNELPAFSELLSDALAFWRQDVSRFTISVWWHACAGYDMEQVRKALTVHAMDPERGQFAPKPADIVRALEGTHTDRALVAWGKALEAMQRVGSYRSVAFDDPAIHATVEDMGGWPKLCSEPFDALTHTQRRFCELHRTHSKQAALAYPPILIGINDAQNRSDGRSMQPPVLIGIADKARAVIEGGSDQTRAPMAGLLGAVQPALRLA